MKKRIIISPKTIQFFTGDFASAIALFPFILIRKKEFKKNKVLMNHELIHLKQQVELLIIPFYLWYGLEYLFKLIYYRNHYKAYRNISFEREAYDNEVNLNYLKTKSFWSFLKFLSRSKIG